MKNFSDSFFFSTHRSNSEQMSSQANAVHIEFKGFLSLHEFGGVLLGTVWGEFLVSREEVEGG